MTVHDRPTTDTGQIPAQGGPVSLPAPVQFTSSNHTLPYGLSHT